MIFLQPKHLLLLLGPQDATNAPLTIPGLQVLLPSGSLGSRGSKTHTLELLFGTPILYVHMFLLWTYSEIQICFLSRTLALRS